MDRRKLNRNICMGIFFFLSGMEYAILLPTLNGYLTILGAEQYFLGIVISAFSIAGLVTAPVYGRITDRTRSTKGCVIVSNCFEILGNILYFSSTDKYMVLGARFVTGIGSGVTPSIFGMITRTTTEEERTGIFSLLLSLGQVGLLFGPACNLFLHSINFNIGNLNINEYTSPGLLMAIAWTAHTLLILAVYKDIEQKAHTTYHISSEYEEIGGKDSCSGFRLIERFEDAKPPTFVQEFLRDEVVVCLAITLIGPFTQAGLESVVAPLTLLFFGWGGLQNSFLFCTTSIAVIMGFISVRFLGKRYSDRVIVLSGAIALNIGLFLSLIFSIILAINEYSSIPFWALPFFLVQVAVTAVSTPFLWVPHVALFSKVTSPQTQAFNQGVRIAFTKSGTILGPIFASSLVTLQRLPVLFGIDLFLVLTVTAMIVFSYKRLKPVEMFKSYSYQNDVSHSSPAVLVNGLDQDDAESAPLLLQNH